MTSRGAGLRRWARRPAVRKVALPLLARVNAGDITVRHPWTGDRVLLHSFRHRGYWFYGSERERQVMMGFIRLVGPGDVVFDVGGHIGFTALLFSTLARDGHIEVFEPGPDNLRYLHRNVDAKPNVTVVEAAAGAHSGRADLQVEDLSGQNNSLVPDEAALGRTTRSAHVRPHTSTIDVSVVTLDDHTTGAPAPDFIKVDVEGFEWEVLQGAERIISTGRPGLMIELTRRRKEVVDALSDHGYLAFDERMHPLDRPPWAGQNVFFLHPERHGWAIDRFTSTRRPPS